MTYFDTETITINDRDSIVNFDFKLPGSPKKCTGIAILSSIGIAGISPAEVSINFNNGIENTIQLPVKDDTNAAYSKFDIQPMSQHLEKDANITGYVKDWDLLYAHEPRAYPYNVKIIFELENDVA